MLRIGEVVQLTDTGRQREANEDSYFSRAPLFAVADGMGGAQAGEVASRMAVEAFERVGDEVDGSPEELLRRTAQEANREIFDLAQGDTSRSGMGTTLTAALVHGAEISFGHVGDSRAYVFRDGKLKQITNDHSLVEELRRQGKLTRDQAAEHPQRSVITRALGPEPQVQVDTMTFSARASDVFLLCSDGLTTMLTDEDVATIVAGDDNLQMVARRLIRAANDRGGRDNITVVAFRLEETDEVVGADDGATLIGPSAEDAGLTADRVREAAERQRRGRELVAAQRPSRWRTAAKVLLVALIVAGLGVAAYFGARQVYFLGIDGGGRVTLYRGLPYELPLGVELYSEVYSIPVQAGSVPEDRRDSLTDHDLRSRDDAVSLLDSIEADAVVPAATGAASSGGQAGGAAEGGGSEGGGASSTAGQEGGAGTSAGAQGGGGNGN